MRCRFAIHRLAHTQAIRAIRVGGCCAIFLHACHFSEAVIRIECDARRGWFVFSQRSHLRRFFSARIARCLCQFGDLIPVCIIRILRGGLAYSFTVLFLYYITKKVNNDSIQKHNSCSLFFTIVLPNHQFKYNNISPNCNYKPNNL